MWRRSSDGRTLLRKESKNRSQSRMPTATSCWSGKRRIFVVVGQPEEVSTGETSTTARATIEGFREAKGKAILVVSG